MEIAPLIHFRTEARETTTRPKLLLGVCLGLLRNDGGYLAKKLEIWRVQSIDNTGGRLIGRH